MSRITGSWKRHFRPAVLNALHRFNGIPVPRDAIAVADYAAASPACRIIGLTNTMEDVIPPRVISGDPAHVEKTLAMIPDREVRSRYVMELLGAKRIRGDDFVAVIEHGRVAHDGGLVVTPENRLLRGVSGIDFGTDLPTNPLHLRYLPNPRQISTSLAIVTCPMPYNYYHWMMEAVPRLGAYAEAGMKIDRVYAPVSRKFQRGTLQLLGIPRGQVVLGTRNSHVRCERLLASSCNTPTTRRKTIFLHNAMTSHLDGRVQPGLRVYVSRRRRGKRIITNDAEVFRSLAPLGFRRYDLETMPVADQVALFYGAECVVAPHGAGLTNIVFCRAGTKVIEVNTPYRTSTCFYDIAHHRGLAYQLHIAQPVDKGFFHFNSSTGLGDSNMAVEPGPFAALVRSFLEDASAEDHTERFRRAIAA